MLEKAKLQQTNLCLIDPLENASRWGIPIWPLERVSFFRMHFTFQSFNLSIFIQLTKWIEKIESSLQNNVPSLRIRPFKGPFIKIEDINKYAD